MVLNARAIGVCRHDGRVWETEVDMTRRHVLGTLTSVAVAPFLTPIQAFGQAIEALDKPLSEWRGLLRRDAYAVLFNEATERPYSSRLNDEKRSGLYICAACYLPLFDAGTKYDSGTGWPSFFAPIEDRLETKRDWKLIIPRTEYHCVRCGGHQGHVFSDGPPPTGQRWCNNGVALKFVPSGEPLPTWRT